MERWPGKPLKDLALSPIYSKHVARKFYKRHQCVQPERGARKLVRRTELASPIDLQQWYELRCEDDNVCVFSAIFYKAPIQLSAGSVLIQTQQGTSWFRYLRASPQNWSFRLTSKIWACIISRQRTCVYTSQLSLPVLAGQVGDLVCHVYVSVPYPVSSELLTNLLGEYSREHTTSHYSWDWGWPKLAIINSSRILSCAGNFIELI